MPNPPATPETIAFGREVTMRRRQNELTQALLAEPLSVTRSYVAQVERGRARCRRDFAERLDSVLNTGTELRDAWNEYLAPMHLSKYPREFASFPRAEATASHIRVYETYVAWGLLQTENYATHILSNEADVESRMRRKEILLSRDPPPTLSVILDESVLHRRVGTDETMREQLEHLLEVSTHDFVFLQVMPFEYHPGVRTSFSVATQADRRELMYMVTATSGETSTVPAQLAYVAALFGRLQAESLNTKDTRVLIRKVIQERWN